MNLFAARVVLRPRSLTEVLDLAAPFCLQNARLLGGCRWSCWCRWRRPSPG